MAALAGENASARDEDWRWRLQTRCSSRERARRAAGSAERSATLERGLRLARLPYARLESRAIARYLGGAETLLGSLASEKALKDRDLQNYDILHFAAHAIADEGRPERSAVLLAPGGANEDGLLQAREIEGLDLSGRVVVLSACETASGAILNGEGVLSLARALLRRRGKNGDWHPVADSRQGRGGVFLDVLSATGTRRLAVRGTQAGEDTGHRRPSSPPRAGPASCSSATAIFGRLPAVGHRRPRRRPPTGPRAPDRSGYRPSRLAARETHLYSPIRLEPGRSTTT